MLKFNIMYYVPKDCIHRLMCQHYHQHVVVIHFVH